MGHGFTSLGDWSPESDLEEVVGINLIRFGELSIAAMSSYHANTAGHQRYCRKVSIPEWELHLKAANNKIHDGYQNGGSMGKCL